MPTKVPSQVPHRYDFLQKNKHCESQDPVKIYHTAEKQEPHQATVAAADAITAGPLNLRTLQSFRYANERE